MSFVIDGFADSRGYNKGAKHVRPHWEYSLELVDIIKEYKEKFPEVFENLLDKQKKEFKSDLRDIYGSADHEAVAKIKKLVAWIDSQPISSLPFVEMGFDTLSPEIIESINEQRQNIEQNFESVNLQVKNVESIHSKVLFAQRFPFWTPLYPDSSPERFSIGDRVMNINGTMR